MNYSSLTISRLARAAGVGIETIRYYQRRNLLPLPEPEGGAFRHYPPVLIDRIRFIKRAQELGFSLDEISTLLKFEDGMDRRSIRSVASKHLDQVRAKITSLQRIEHSLSHLIDACVASGRAERCPIIEALAKPEQQVS